MEEKTYTASMPTFIDDRVVKKVWVNHDNTERVFIFENTDGTWGLCSDYFSDHETEMCWVSNDMGGHFYDSEKTAVKELEALYLWAKEVDPFTL